MEIIYSKHFLDRKKLRLIPDGLAENVLTQADEYYFDNETKCYIAVKNIKFQGKVRNVSLTFVISDNKIIIITLHPLKKGQKENRIVVMS